MAHQTDCMWAVLKIGNGALKGMKICTRAKTWSWLPSDGGII